MKKALLIILLVYVSISQYIINGLSKDVDKMFTVNKNLLESCVGE